jgi:hypothetical protein
MFTMNREKMNGLAAPVCSRPPPVIAAIIISMRSCRLIAGLTILDCWHKAQVGERVHDAAADTVPRRNCRSCAAPTLSAVSRSMRLDFAKVHPRDAVGLGA